MLARMIQIDDLGRSVKLLIREVPNPEGAVAEHTDLGCPVQTATLGLLIDQLSKGFDRLNRPRVAG